MIRNQKNPKIKSFKNYANKMWPGSKI